jgi:predicted DsbA family dithiol-disulfide isomerase
MLTLDIFSDPVCPWCYIGKTHLDRALESRADHPFIVAWHPFQLHPDMPLGGVPLAPFLQEKFGGPEQATAAQTHVEQAAKDAGISIDMSRVPRMPNTFNAHRLIHWAGLEGRQTPVVSALFRAYWVQSRDIGDVDTLAHIAGEAGLDAAMIARLLASDADEEALLTREDHARERGVRAVPTFIIANQYVLSGAQAPSLWTQVMEDLAGSQG